METLITPLERPPIDEALLACARLLRLGVPPAITSPLWEEITDPCPPGHPILPEGTRIYLPSMKEEVVTPAIIIFEDGEAEPRFPNSQRYWSMGVRIDLELRGDQTLGMLRARQADLQRLFTETLPTGDPSTAAPWDRLNAASVREAEVAGTQEYLHVFPGGITEARSRPLTTLHGHPVISLTFKLWCATRTELPSSE